MAAISKARKRAKKLQAEVERLTALLAEKRSAPAGGTRKGGRS